MITIKDDRQTIVKCSYCHKEFDLTLTAGVFPDMYSCSLECYRNKHVKNNTKE